MNNDDFSRLLTTNDTALITELTKSRKARAGAGGGNEAAQAKRKERAEKFKTKGKGKGKDEGKGSGGQSAGPKEAAYRDRAAERKEGKGEYETVAAEFESLGEIAIDQSKFLGGDLDHTHLVKGLDFSLLSKVRTEMTKQAKAEELQQQRQQKKAGVPKKKAFDTQLGKRVYHSIIETLHPHHITFKKRLLNMGKALAIGQRIRGAPSTFLPGRMAYEFDLDTDVSKAGRISDIPRTIYTSKEAAPNVDMTIRVAPILLETVKLVGNALHKVAEARKQRRKEKAAGTTAQAVVVAEKVILIKQYKAKDADDDIFGGIGNFDPVAIAREAAEKKAREAKVAASKLSKTDEKSAPKKASYFSDAGSEKYLQAPEGQLELNDVHFEERDEPPMPGDKDRTCAFKASDKFKGARPGCVFKLGAQGLGYYRDEVSTAAAKAANDPSDPRSLAAKKAVAGGEKRKRGAGAPAEGGGADAYDECFPSSGLGHASVDTGEGGDSDDEGNDIKSKIERLKKLAGKKMGEEDSMASNRKGGEGKKKQMSEAQQWNKIDNMIKKGKISSIDEIDARQSGKRRTPASREIGRS